MVARVIHCKKCGMEADQYKDGYCEDCYAEVICEFYMESVGRTYSNAPIDTEKITVLSDGVLRLKFARQIADWDGVCEATDAQWDTYLSQADELIVIITSNHQ